MKMRFALSVVVKTLVYIAGNTVVVVNVLGQILGRTLMWKVSESAEGGPESGGKEE